MRTRTNTYSPLIRAPSLEAGPSGLLAAFTLIEILVVVAIMALAMGAILPSVAGFFSGTRLADASNLISANLTNARNYAVTNNVTTALVFVEDDDGNTSRTLMFLAKSPDQVNFTAVAGQETTHLSDKIMLTNNTTIAIAICFLPAGQLTTLTILPGNVTWPTDVDAPASVTSATEFDIYDYVVSSTVSEQSFYINYYTGMVVEQ